MKEVELKPCPFCGGEAIVYEDEENDCYMIGCKSCCAVEPMTEWCESKEDAIVQWNTRKPMEQIVERLDDMYQPCYLCREDRCAIDRAIEIVKEVGGMHERSI